MYIQILCKGRNLQNKQNSSNQPRVQVLLDDTNGNSRTSAKYSSKQPRVQVLLDDTNGNKRTLGKYSSKQPRLEVLLDDEPSQNVRVNIWAQIDVGTTVFVSLIERNFFGAVVVEIDLDLEYVGLRTVSGITYVPIDNILSVRINSC